MQTIDISLIKTDNQYLRLDTDVEKLKKSIETVGLINPIVINQNNELIAGGRRFTALTQLGYTEVPVFQVDKSELEQELISIDENLVRKDLENIELEKSLTRGLEIYEQLYPEATKFDEEDLSNPEAKEIQFDQPNDKRSFIDLTAEKTGLSKKVIKSAIERESNSSDKVKQLRAAGELNASQTNEIIKLEEKDQEQIADLVTGKSAKDVRMLVKSVKEKGLQSAVNEYINSPQLPKEYQSLSTLLKRTNKIMGKILLEEMKSDNEKVSDILDQISTLRLSLDQFLVLCADESIQAEDTSLEASSESETPADYNYDQVISTAMDDFSHNPDQDTL